MRKSLLFILAASSLVITCKNLESADPAPRSTFIKFYEGPYSITAIGVEKIPGGFAILGNMNRITEKGIQIQTVLIETDEQGVRKGDFHYYDRVTSRAFKPIIKSGALDQYIIVGDSISVNPTAQQSANVEIYSISVLLVPKSFEKEKEKRKYIRDLSTDSTKIRNDYFAGSIGLTGNSTGTGAVILGTFKEGITNQQNAPEEQLLWGLDTDFNNDWETRYPLLTNTYSNAKSVHYRNGNIIWASAIADVQGDFISSYLAIPFVKEQSVPINFSQFKETTSQRFLPKDIQPASSPEFGYGVVGTYSEAIDGSKSNLFFLRVTADGTIIKGSERYFDAIGTIDDSTPDIIGNESEIIDTGDAITSTSDGGFLLAGTLTTNPAKGNGGKDLLLIKVNSVGDLVWIKTMGGIGDEQPVAVTEAANGDILVCGTNNLLNYSSIFLMRIDKNGELKN